MKIDEEKMCNSAGMATENISKYIHRVEILDECIDKNMLDVFSEAEWKAGGSGFRWDVLCNDITKACDDGTSKVGFEPKIRPNNPRWCHIDTSVSGDATGFCVGHIEKMVEVIRSGENGARCTELEPFYYIDIMLGLKPSTGEQFDLSRIRQLIYELSIHGYDICGVSTDSYQYMVMHHQLEGRGFHTQLTSMDRTTDPYYELKRAIYEDRIRFGFNDTLIKELKGLEYDSVKDRIDHDKGGSKDLSDSLAGVVFNLMNNSIVKV